MQKLVLLIVPAIFVVSSCGSDKTKKITDGKSGNLMENLYQVKLITVDPGHFHAALVQKRMYDRYLPRYMFMLLPERIADSILQGLIPITRGP